MRFFPAGTIFVYAPNSPTDPNGSWTAVDEGGSPCQGTGCLALPEPRAAGTAVSVGGSIYVLGGAVFNRGAGDPNEAIRATNSVVRLDTSEKPHRWEAGRAADD